MSIYRCNQCAFVSEDATSPVGSKIQCGRCGQPCTVYGTVFYVEKLVERYFASVREVNILKQQEKDGAETSPSSLEDYSTSLASLAKVDTLNTALFATPAQHAPLKSWFSDRKIETTFDYSLVDTTGFFDDAARLIGEAYALFKELVDRVCYAYRKGHTGVSLELANLSQKDAQAVNTLCRQLYSHTFFARYHYQKPEKVVRLTLQTAQTVRQFFDGGWLEWFAFIEVVEQLKARDISFSCARGVKVRFENEDLHELDVVLLPQGQAPICIECKSGEFRRDIDKYLRLRKRLGIERSRFIICAADLTEDQASGLSAMYELTFVNLTSLPARIQNLI